tara:strand:- start:99 stop:776 length:678 start_codon:yes stop_codon:yes gene_type:complete
MVNLILIPARKGSVGVKNKNMLEFCGAPLIEHTLKVCKKSMLKETITMVSTDCSKTIKIANKYSFYHGYIRPKYLSTNKAKIIDTAFHAVDWIEKKKKCVIKNVILLQPTSPFRSHNEVTSAFDIFMKKKLKSLVSVSPVIQSPYEMVSLSNEKLNFLLKNVDYRRQDYKKNFHFIDGSIYIASTEFLRKYKTFANKYSYPYQLNTKYRIDIDDVEDFNVAQKLF